MRMEPSAHTESARLHWQNLTEAKGRKGEGSRGRKVARHQCAEVNTNGAQYSYYERKKGGTHLLNLCASHGTIPFGDNKDLSFNERLFTSRGPHWDLRLVYWAGSSCLCKPLQHHASRHCRERERRAKPHNRAVDLLEPQIHFPRTEMS